MRQLVIATGNQHKLDEMRVLLKDCDYRVVGQKEIGKDIDVEETGTTFLENARIKALAISNLCNDLVMADDSGLVIDALGGEPGINSARYMGHDTSYDIKNQKILDRMENETNRAARFVCAISLCKDGQVVYEVEETFEGEIAKEVLGENGFGYDPIFYFPEMKKGSAEMTMEEKNSVSHRGKAVRKIITYLIDNENK